MQPFIRQLNQLLSRANGKGPLHYIILYVISPTVTLRARTFRCFTGGLPVIFFMYARWTRQDVTWLEPRKRHGSKAKWEEEAAEIADGVNRRYVELIVCAIHYCIWLSTDRNTFWLTSSNHHTIRISSSVVSVGLNFRTHMPPQHFYATPMTSRDRQKSR